MAVRDFQNAWHQKWGERRHPVITANTRTLFSGSLLSVARKRVQATLYKRDTVAAMRDSLTHSHTNRIVHAYIRTPHLRARRRGPKRCPVRTGIHRHALRSVAATARESTRGAAPSLARPRRIRAPPRGRGPRDCYRRACGGGGKKRDKK